MASDVDKSTELTVTEALQEDVDRWVARFHSADMDRMDLEDGEAVKVTGQRSTAVFVHAGNTRPDPGYVALDGPTRANADVSLGETVKVEKYHLQTARAVVLAAEGQAESRLASDSESARLLRMLDWAPVAVQDLVNPCIPGSRSLALRVASTSP